MVGPIPYVRLTLAFLVAAVFLLASNPTTAAPPVRTADSRDDAQPSPTPDPRFTIQTPVTTKTPINLAKVDSAWLQRMSFQWSKSDQKSFHRERRPADLVLSRLAPAGSVLGYDSAVPDVQEGPAAVPRLDHAVLQWLPEIASASQITGTPSELIAGIMQVESQGYPGAISPAGAQGLMQVMPDGLIAMGIPEEFWLDPATNILAGARLLADRSSGGTDWLSAVASYLGYGCDIFGTCTDVYVQAVFNWASYYGGVLQNLGASGIPVLGPNWIPPEILPFQVSAPVPMEAPPVDVESAEAPVYAAEVAVETAAKPSATEPVATVLPVETPKADPTIVATEIPNEIPTEIATEVVTTEPTPVEPTPEPIPSQEPTDVPIVEPAEVESVETPAAG